MRMNLLMLGMLIPFAIAIAWYGMPSAVSGPSAVERIYAAEGARVLTGEVDELLSDGSEGLEALASAPPAAPADAGWLEEWVGWLPAARPQRPLLVVLVDGRERVAVAREGFADDRIAGETEDAFVSGGDLLVAGSRDAAAAMITLLDWIHRPIELVAVQPRKRPVALRKGRRNSDAEAMPLLDPIAAEVAAVRGADQARIQQAVDTVRDAAR